MNYEGVEIVARRTGMSDDDRAFQGLQVIESTVLDVEGKRHAAERQKQQANKEAKKRWTRR